MKKLVSSLGHPLVLLFLVAGVAWILAPTAAAALLDDGHGKPDAAAKLKSGQSKLGADYSSGLQNQEPAPSSYMSPGANSFVPLIGAGALGGSTGGLSAPSSGAAPNPQAPAAEPNANPNQQAALHKSGVQALVQKAHSWFAHDDRSSGKYSGEKTARKEVTFGALWRGATRALSAEHKHSTSMPSTAEGKRVDRPQSLTRGSNPHLTQRSAPNAIVTAQNHAASPQRPVQQPRVFQPQPQQRPTVIFAPRFFNLGGGFHGGFSGGRHR